MAKRLGPDGHDIEVLRRNTADCRAKGDGIEHRVIDAEADIDALESSVTLIEARPVPIDSVMQIGTNTTVSSMTPAVVKATYYTSQAGVPSSTPAAKGLFNQNTTNGDMYVSVGSASSTDWELTHDAGRDLAADGTKLDGIEDAADVTDTANVDAAGAVMESDFTPAFSLIVQQSGTGAPEMLSVGTNTIVGRVTGGGSEIDDLSPTQVRSLINVEDGATADQDADEVDDTSTTNKFVTAADLTVLGNTSGINSGDEVEATTAISGISEHANPTEAEAGAAIDRVLTPNSIANLIKKLPKAFGTFDPKVSPTVDANGFNIASITRVSAGLYTITFTDNVTTPYTAQVTAEDATATAFIVGTGTQLTGSFPVSIRDSAGSLSDAAERVSITVHSYNI